MLCDESRKIVDRSSDNRPAVGGCFVGCNVGCAVRLRHARRREDEGENDGGKLDHHGVVVDVILAGKILGQENCELLPPLLLETIGSSGSRSMIAPFGHWIQIVPN